MPTFLGNQLFPLDNPWNQVVADAPVAANSDAIISRIIARHGGTAPRAHADFGNPVTDGALYGIPINVATAATPRYTVHIPSQGYADESDAVSVPIPNGAVIEGDGPTGPAPVSVRGDSHLLVYDRDANDLYELFGAARPSESALSYGGSKPLGQWGAYQVSYWDLDTNDFRTVGDTSADAAGLPILTGLVRPDEVNPPAAGGVGVIDHAIRMTVQQTRNLFVYPASHVASSRSDADLPRMGERFRLKSSFVIPSTWSPEAKAIATAMKTYGLIVADNGSDLFFTGTPSDTWNIGAVRQVQSIRATDLEVVDLTPTVTGLSASSGTTAGGTQVTITGKNFSGAAGRLHVLFGTTEAASYTILSDTRIIAVAPAHAAGTVDVRVQSGEQVINNSGRSVFFGYGTSANTAIDDFNFTAVSPPVPVVSVGSVRKSEWNSGLNPFAFTVSLSQASTAPVTVSYGTADGTAAAGSDYVAAAGSVTFAPGETKKTVTVYGRGDGVPEPDEVFFLNLTGATGATIGAGTGTGTIVNDDKPSPPAVSASVGSVRKSEWNSGLNPFAFTVSLSQASATAVTVYYSTADGTAAAGTDYTALSGSVTFAPGETTKAVTVYVLGDTAVEADETFVLKLTGATGATIGAGTGTATITNDDALAPAGTSVSVSSVRKSEWNSGLNPFAFTVSLSQASTAPVTVYYSTADGTAAAGSDYVAAAGSVTFAPGETKKTVTVSGRGDGVPEPDEVFFLNLTGATGATIGAGTGTGTIVNDD